MYTQTTLCPISIALGDCYKRIFVHATFTYLDSTLSCFSLQPVHATFPLLSLTTSPNLAASSAPRCIKDLHRSRNLSLRFASTFRPCCTFYPLGLGPLEVMCRDPAFVVCLHTTRDSRTICPNNSYLVRGIHFLPSERLPGPFAALTTASFLRKEGGDPGFVDEVEGAEEDSEEENVEEYSVKSVRIEL